MDEKVGSLIGECQQLKKEVQSKLKEIEKVEEEKQALVEKLRDVENEVGFASYSVPMLLRFAIAFMNGVAMQMLIFSL